MEPIPGGPLVLVVSDEQLPAAFADPLVAALRRRGVSVHDSSPIDGSAAGRSLAADDANCLLLVRRRSDALPASPASPAPRLLILADAGDQPTLPDDVAPSDAFPAVVH